MIQNVMKYVQIMEYILNYRDYEYVYISTDSYTNRIEIDWKLNFIINDDYVNILFMYPCNVCHCTVNVTMREISIIMIIVCLQLDKIPIWITGCSSSRLYIFFVIFIHTFLLLQIFFFRLDWFRFIHLKLITFNIISGNNLYLCRMLRLLQTTKKNI